MKEEPDNSLNVRQPLQGGEDRRNRDPDAPVMIMQCEDMQAVLFDYMSRELGPARSDLVRQHLRKCQNCQAAAAEIGETMNLLRETSKALAVPEHLSEDHRKHIIWAVTHPIMDWVDRHHTIASFVLAVIVIICLLVALWHVKLAKWQDAEIIEVSIMGSDVTNVPLDKIEEIREPDDTDQDAPRLKP